MTELPLNQIILGDCLELTITVDYSILLLCQKEHSKIPVNAHDESLSHRGGGLDKRDGKYSARITVHGKRIAVGYFKTAEDAGSAYREAAKQYYGEFYKDTGLTPSAAR